jgi:ribosomal protein S18 acetylase RimI-like enzyme
MGLLPEYRAQGLGRKLAERAISDARARGITRIELEVFSSNTRAICFYERLGFVHEGVKRNARQLDGGYDDLVLMAFL